MHSTLDICPRPARKRTNVPPQKRVYCPNIYTVIESVNIMACQSLCVISMITLVEYISAQSMIYRIKSWVLIHVTKVLSLSLSLQMKIQIMGGKINENLEFKSQLLKVKYFLSFFVFIFKFSKKLHNFAFNHFWISCFRNLDINKNKDFLHVFFFLIN